MISNFVAMSPSGLACAMRAGSSRAVARRAAPGLDIPWLHQLSTGVRKAGGNKAQPGESIALRRGEGDAADYPAPLAACPVSILADILFPLVSFSCKF